MNIYIQTIIALIFIIATQFLLDYYLLKKYHKNLDPVMGPEIGEPFQFDKIKASDLLNSTDTTELENSMALLCFVSPNCSSCHDFLMFLNDTYQENHKKLCVIAMGDLSNLGNWYKDNQYIFNVYYAEQNIVLNEFKINMFPYYVLLKYSIVTQKGPFYKELLDAPLFDNQKLNDRYLV